MMCYRMRSFLYCTAISVLLPFQPSAQYVEVKAEKSQGVYGMLRKFDLLQFSCNLDQFYKINKLKAPAALKNGARYKLPITVHSYDGKSIRSSIKITDYQKAKEIETYNLLAYKAGLKKGDFRQDKVLWLPYHFESCYKPHAEISFSREIPKPEAKALPQTPSETELLAAASSGQEATKPSPDDKDADNKTQYALAGAPGSHAEPNQPEAPPNDGLIATNRVKYFAEGMVKKVSSNAVTVPLFGRDKELVEIKDNKLAGQVFYILPGHGGPDPGAVAKNVEDTHTICEDEYAYDVSLRLAKNLLQSGATVYVIVQDRNDGIRDEKFLVCDCDETVIGGDDIPLNQKKRLQQGMSKINRLYSKHKKRGIDKQWMVSIHVDSRKEHDRQDVFFYYQNDSEVSKKRARRIQEVFDEQYKRYRKDEEYSGTITARPLFVMRKSLAEAIFVELGNIQNSRDQKRILLSRNRQLLADWLYQGFLD